MLNCRRGGDFGAVFVGELTGVTSMSKFDEDGLLLVTNGVITPINGLTKSYKCITNPP